jgi:predicted RNase H-like HicB family nuclease
VKLTVVLRRHVDDWEYYVAECPAIPGCISEGRTVDEALANIREAAELCMETLADMGEPMPSEGDVVVAVVDAAKPI